MEPCPDCVKWRADYVLQGPDNSIVHLCKCREEPRINKQELSPLITVPDNVSGLYGDVASLDPGWPASWSWWPFR